MLRETIDRLEGFPYDRLQLICNEDHRFLAAEQVRTFHGLEPLILEPSPRNTAASIALSALRALSIDEDPFLLVLPADHFVGDVESVHHSLTEASRIASNGALVAIGVPATEPETGYGYIKRGSPLSDSHCFHIDEFVEKPSKEEAHRFVADGRYLWNTGIYLFKAATLLSELETFRPEILGACKAAYEGSETDMNFLRVKRDAFLESPAESIDRAVMENTAGGVVVPLETAWRDVGSWENVWETLDGDVDGNVLHGDVVAEDTAGCLVRSEGRLVALYGVSDLVVVETKDAVLVVEKSKSQSVKCLVETLASQNRQEYLRRPEVYRPWGMYEVIDKGHRYRVKRITVNPGEGLSLQMHHHRAEHWVVVSGTARVQQGEYSYLVTENESTFIAVGEVHRLENPGIIPLEMIEVQSGSYLEEDDIRRLEDRYGRSSLS